MLLPTINAFLREYRIGVFKDLLDSVLIKHANVIILTPTNEEIDKIIKSFKGNEIKNFVIYPFEVANEMKINTITILVVDKRESLVIEKTDDSKENFENNELPKCEKCKKLKTRISFHYNCSENTEKNCLFYLLKKELPLDMNDKLTPYKNN